MIPRIIHQSWKIEQVPERWIVCNALFASVPRHPFWEHLFPFLMTSSNEGNVLEASGPFVLTRACNSYPRPEEITILPSGLLYPLDHYLQPTGAIAGGDAANG